MSSLSDLPTVRWLCWPDHAVTASCVRGLCHKCDKPPHRRKQSRSQMLKWAESAGISTADVNQGMLFRPVRSTKTSRR